MTPRDTMRKGRFLRDAPRKRRRLTPRNPVSGLDPKWLADGHASHCRRVDKVLYARLTYEPKLDTTIRAGDDMI